MHASSATARKKPSILPWLLMIATNQGGVQASADHNNHGQGRYFKMRVSHVDTTFKQLDSWPYRQQTQRSGVEPHWDSTCKQLVSGCGRLKATRDEIRCTELHWLGHAKQRVLALTSASIRVSTYAHVLRDTACIVLAMVRVGPTW